MSARTLSLDDAEGYVRDVLAELGGSDGGRLLERLLQRRKVAGPLTLGGHRYNLLGERVGTVLARGGGGYRWRLAGRIDDAPSGITTGGDAHTRTGADIELCLALLERGYLVLEAP